MDFSTDNSTITDSPVALLKAFLSPENSGFDETEAELPAFSFVYPKGEEEEVGLNTTQEGWVVNELTKMWDAYDQQRAGLKRRWQEAERMIKGVVSEVKRDRFYAIAPLGKQTVQTLISHFWNRSLSTDKQLFSVFGNDEESKDLAPDYKEYLSEQLKKDKFSKKMDTSLLLHFFPKGVTILHTGKCVKTQKYVGPDWLVSNWAGDGFGDPENQNQ
jgi:hypothetical protein